MTIDTEKFNSWSVFVFNEAAEYVKHDASGEPITDAYMDQFYQEEVKYKINPTTSVVYMNRLFNQCENLTKGCSEDQIAYGLRYIVEYEYFEGISKLNNSGIPWAIRQSCIVSIYEVYQYIFAQRCTPELGSTNPPSPNSLNQTCYLWWGDKFALSFIRNSLFNFITRKNKTTPEFDQEILELFERILSIKHEACQESALHGLALYHKKCPSETTQMINKFLQDNPDISDPLKTFAQKAKTGKLK